MNREEFQRLADDRVLDAEALIAAGRWSAAYYLLGYALECALKSCINAQITKDSGILFKDKDFGRKCWTHDLTDLLKLADLKLQLDDATKVNQNLGKNWSLAICWSEIIRYQHKERVDAEELFEAVTHPIDGVLAWLKTHW